MIAEEESLRQFRLKTFYKQFSVPHEHSQALAPLIPLRKFVPHSFDESAMKLQVEVKTSVSSSILDRHNGYDSLIIEVSMEVNRVFICHAINRENKQDLQKLYSLMRVLKKAGLEVVTDQDDGPAEQFFPLLQQKLLTCQVFILLQTPDAVSAPRVILAVRAAQRLARQERMYIFRFILSLEMERATLQEWNALATFDGTHYYSQTSERLVRAITTKDSNKSETVSAVMRGISSTFPRLSLLKTPSPKTAEWSQTRPSHTIGVQSQMLPSVKVESLPHMTIEASPIATALGQTMTKAALQRKNTDKTRGEHSMLILTLIPLVILLIIGSVGTLFFLGAAKSTSPTPIYHSSAKFASPTSNPIVGQAFFISSDQTGTDYNTGICDEIQVYLNHLAPQTASKSYYAWLLPDGALSAESPAVFLGRLTVNNRAASMTYTNSTHENLLLTRSRFLITEESTSSPPSIPPSDQHVWRYVAALPQTPAPQDPHYSYLDHIRHLLVGDPMLQQLGMRGGLSTWFYENVRSVLTWAGLAQSAGDARSFPIVRSNAISILDYLDGLNFVAGDVPPGTAIAADPQISRVPLLSLGPDPVNQNPLGYIQHIEYHLQGLTDSPGATDAQRTLASKIVHELDTINGLLEQVRQDAKQLVHMSNTEMATSVTASLLTDLVANANSAFVGQFDPATNTRQGGATWVHDVLPQLATLNVKEAS